MSNPLQQRSQNLTKQSLFLVFGKIFSLPITFLIPVILTRTLTVEEFGQYKQIFIIFSLALPLLDFGVTQGLLYHLPRKERKGDIFAHYLLYQILLCLFLIFGFSAGSEWVSYIITDNYGLAPYVPLIGVLLVIWAVSANLEIIFTTRKNTFLSGIVIFLSDGLKGLCIILAVLLGGKLTEILLAFILVACLRLLWMILFLLKRRYLSGCKLSLQTGKRILAYSIPLGIALSLNSLIDYSHHVIVSNKLSVADYALYSIGCFQVPIIAVMARSISMVVIVRISEMDGVEMGAKLSDLLSNSFRKLAILFMPLFVLLWVTAESFIEVLYTSSYLASVPVFRTFIVILPLSVFLVEYVPRALGDSFFNMRVNVLTLFFNVIFVFFLLELIGISGAALGFVLSNAFRKICMIWYMKRHLSISVRQLIPFRNLVIILGFACLSSIPGIILIRVASWPVLIELCIQWTLFPILCLLLYWNCGVLLETEKEILQEKLRNFVNKTGVGKITR